MRIAFRSLRALAAVAGVAALAACEAADNPTQLAEQGGTAFSAFPTIPGQPDGLVNYEQFEVCKYGSSGDFSYDLHDYNTGNDFSGVFSVPAGTCVLLAAFDRYGGDVSVTETASQAGFQFDHVEVFVNDESAGASNYTQTTPSVTEFIAGQLGGRRGAVAKYYNVEIPTGGGEGCTPGYWKQEHHFDSWTSPYAPTTLFSAVFEDAFPGKTLLQVLQLGGGGLNALGRHTVAALLNAASGGVEYDMDTQEVIDAFNAVYPGGDYEGQKNIFVGYNEQGCPLN